MCGKCLNIVWDLVSTRWIAALTHWNYCQTVLRNPIFNLYTLYLTQFWFLLSDAVNGSWRRCGSWVSERWSDLPRTTQLVAGKAGFYWKSTFSRAGSFPAGHSKGMRVFLSVCILWQSQFPQKCTRRSHSSGLLLSSSPLGSALSLCPGCSTTWNIIPSLPPSVSILSPTTLLRSCLLVSGDHSSMFPQLKACFPAASSTQATLASLSHTDRGFRKCKLS